MCLNISLYCCYLLQLKEVCCCTVVSDTTVCKSLYARKRLKASVIVFQFIFVAITTCRVEKNMDAIRTAAFIVLQGAG